MTWATKYRPDRFCDVVGQEDAVLVLKSIIVDAIPRSVLISGPYGTGKTTLARIYARKVLDIPGGDDVTDSIGYVEIDAATHGGIDSVRQILQDAQYCIGSTRPVFVFDEAHGITPAAQNALLIATEEGCDAHFIFCTTNPAKLNATFRSRLVPCDLKTLSLTDIADQLAYIARKEDVEFDTVGLRLLATASRGHLRDAITLLESARSGLETEVRKFLGLDRVVQIYEALACTQEERVPRVHALLQELAPSELANRMATVLTQLMLAEVGIADGLADADLAWMRKIHDSLSWHPSVFGISKKLFELRTDFHNIHYGVAGICAAFEQQEERHAPIMATGTGLPRKPGM